MRQRRVSLVVAMIYFKRALRCFVQLLVSGGAFVGTFFAMVFVVTTAIEVPQPYVPAAIIGTALFCLATSLFVAVWLWRRLRFWPTPKQKPSLEGERNEVAQPLRRHLRFRLRSALLLFVVVGAALALVRLKLAHDARERRAMAAIREAGGDDGAGMLAPWASWIPRSWGREFVYRVSDVNFYGAGLRDADLPPLFEHLHRLYGVDGLEFTGNPIGDDGVRRICESMPYLRSLRLKNTQISDAAIPHLSKLTRLYWLDIENTNVTDASVADLAQMKGLTYLKLEGSSITPAGRARLAKALPNCKIP